MKKKMLSILLTAVLALGGITAFPAAPAAAAGQEAVQIDKDEIAGLSRSELIERLNHYWSTIGWKDSDDTNRYTDAILSTSGGGFGLSYDSDKHIDEGSVVVPDVEEYIGRWPEMAEELALEETEGAYLYMENAYQNDAGLFVEWDKENWNVVNKGDTSISVFGIRIGDAQSDVQKNLEAVKNKYNACSPIYYDEPSERVDEIMIAAEQGYYMLAITYDSSGKASEWGFKNEPEGTYYEDLVFILDVQKKYGRLAEDSWKSAYIGYLSKVVSQSYSEARGDDNSNVSEFARQFCLIRLNNDKIPELYITSENIYVPHDYLLTVKNGKIDEFVLDGSGHFIQKKNLFRYYESSGYSDDTAKESIYTIKNGKFKLKASGRIKIRQSGKRSYTWNGKNVSQTKYRQQLQKVYPLKKETSLKEQKVYQIDQIVKQIMEA